MNNLLLLLLFIFGGVALMVVLGERFAKPADPERMQQLSRWLMPLVGIALVLGMLNHFFFSQ
jgi:cadmium resistance protein CadD (predicted permease)